MRRFVSPGRAQQFLSVYADNQNRFRLGNRPLRPEHYRLLRARSFEAWSVATGTQAARLDAG